MDGKACSFLRCTGLPLRSIGLLLCRLYLPLGRCKLQFQPFRSLNFSLELLLWATRARLYQKQKGQLPADRLQLTGLPMEWEIYKDYDDSVCLVTKDRRFRIRMSQ